MRCPSDGGRGLLDRGKHGRPVASRVPAERSVLTASGSDGRDRVEAGVTGSAHHGRGGADGSRARTGQGRPPRPAGIGSHPRTMLPPGPSATCSYPRVTIWRTRSAASPRRVSPRRRQGRSREGRERRPVLGRNTRGRFRTDRRPHPALETASPVPIAVPCARPSSAAMRGSRSLARRRSRVEPGRHVRIVRTGTAERPARSPLTAREDALDLARGSGVVAATRAGHVERLPDRAGVRTPATRS